MIEEWMHGPQLLKFGFRDGQRAVAQILFAPRLVTVKANLALLKES